MQKMSFKLCKSMVNRPLVIIQLIGMGVHAATVILVMLVNSKHASAHYTTYRDGSSRSNCNFSYVSQKLTRLCSLYNL